MNRRKPRTVFCVTLVCLVLLAVTADASSAQQVPDQRIPVLYMRQESNGLPGQPLESSAIQELFVARDRLALFDHRTESTFLFRLDQDPPSIWEVFPDRKHYQDAAAMQDIQRDRDLAESQRLVILRREFSGEELERALRREHLRADGSREVTVDERPAEGEKLLGYPVRHYRVRENGRTIVDLKVTEALNLEIPFFDFYRQVGAFSKEVLEKLREIEGVPLEATITVVTATLNVELRARVVFLEERRVPKDRFELPPGATEYKESLVAPCKQCGTEVEKSDPGARAAEQGRPLYFCTKAHKKAYIEARRRASAGSAGGGGKSTGPAPGKPPDKPPK